MNDFFEKPKYTEEDIERIINESWEESLNLEFKSSDSLNNTDLNKKEISKDISAFANSAGGIVIYGIRKINMSQKKLRL
jgi:predicted HTH transcriptional regulator